MEPHDQAEALVGGRYVGRAVFKLTTALTLLAGAVFYVQFSVSRHERFDTPFSGHSSRRVLSKALPNGGCKVTYAHLTENPIPQTWQASFPGSGSRMTWSLVEALTGIKTNDDFDSHERGYENVVAVKTHYPVKDAYNRFNDLDKTFSRAIVILRNPINAIPSYFNLQYEHMHKLPNHSTRGPNKDWLIYREHEYHGVAVQIQNFEKFVSYWMERYENRNDLLLVSYEDLTDDIYGPSSASRIAEFLGQSKGVDPIARESIPCVWHTIVKYKDIDLPPQPEKKIRRRLDNIQLDNSNSQNNHLNPASLRTGPKERPYTEQNLREMIAMFQRLSAKYSFDGEFVRIMASYTRIALSIDPEN